MIEIPLMSEKEIGELVDRRRDTLQAAMDANMMPPAEAGFLCSYCPAVMLCDEGMNEVAL